MIYIYFVLTVRSISDFRPKNAFQRLSSRSIVIGYYYTARIFLLIDGSKADKLIDTPFFAAVDVDAGRWRSRAASHDFIHHRNRKSQECRAYRCARRFPTRNAAAADSLRFPPSLVDGEPDILIIRWGKGGGKERKTIAIMRRVC